MIEEKVQKRIIEMDKIEFNQTSNIFVNTGIIGLYRYLGKYKRLNPKTSNYDFKLETNRLVLEGEDLLKLLEEVYYLMGKDIYDTPDKKQIAKMENVYYVVKDNKFHRFPKMNTYGLTELLTNNAQGTTRLKENSTKIKVLEKEDSAVSDRIKNYFNKNNLKLLSKVYLNEPYTKITRLQLEEKYWQVGNLKCPLSGEKFKYLEEGINISPFLSGLQNFNSFIGSSDIKISQKALYLVRFSPVLAMYSYINGRDSLICSFFNSDNLLNINDSYNSDYFYEKDEMMNWKFPYRSNIKLHTFYYVKKDGEGQTIDGGNDSYSPEEVTFLILLTFYKNKLQDSLDTEIPKNDIDLFKILGIDNAPLNIISIKAEKFAGTKRPNFYEEYTNTKYIIHLIHNLETHVKKRVPIKELWRGLTVRTDTTEALKDYNKRKKAENQLRQEVIRNILKGKSILKLMVSLFHKSYLRNSKGEYSGYRRYDLLLRFLEIYQATLNNQNMDKDLQQRAINLGKSIGQAIVNYENPKNDNERKANAKNGRKYLIGLHKARTIEQFRDNLIRIQSRYGVSIANGILENMNSQNYTAIKQYAQMGALNLLNFTLSNNQKND